MKKLTMLLALVLMLTAAAAEHVHTSNGQVDMDLNERWELCDCGEQVNVTQHVWETDEWGDQRCSLCGAQQYLWDDGTLELCGMDEMGSIVRQISWNAEGEVTMNLATTYQYDEAGHVLSAWYYDEGSLISESEFALGSDGYEYESRAITYEDDGSMTVCEYNEHGDQTLVEYYYEGELESSLRYEYTYDAAGYITRVRTFSEDALIEETDYVTLQDGDNIAHYPARLTVWYEDDTRVVYINDEKGDTVSEACYDAAGNLLVTYTYESVYDAEGFLKRMTTWTDGVLTSVEDYAVDADGWTYCAMETLYAPDGTSTVTRYDENGDVVE